MRNEGSPWQPLSESQQGVWGPSPTTARNSVPAITRLSLEAKLAPELPGKSSVAILISALSTSIHPWHPGTMSCCGTDLLNYEPPTMNAVCGNLFHSKRKLISQAVIGLEIIDIKRQYGEVTPPMAAVITV